MGRFDNDDEFLSDDIYYDDPETLNIFDDIDEISRAESQLLRNTDIVDDDLELNIQAHRGKNYYLPPENLIKEYELSLLNDEPTPKFIQYFFTIAQNVSVLLKLKNQLDIDSCVNFAVSNMWAAKWRKYDEHRTENIFSFYTTVLLNDMRTHKNKIYKSSHKNIPIDLLFIE